MSKSKRAYFSNKQYVEKKAKSDQVHIPTSSILKLQRAISHEVAKNDSFMANSYLVARNKYCGSTTEAVDEKTAEIVASQKKLGTNN